MGLVGAGIGSVLTSFVFVFPYIGFVVNNLEHVAEMVLLIVA